jgi:tRNA pseudouridine31 synthase
LKGGVHKYLEEFGVDMEGLFIGKNFVFDSRLAATANGTCSNRGQSTASSAASKEETVGRCISCKNAFDTFDPRFVCTVCREPVLICLSCRETVSEFHCKNHDHLKTCYFSSLMTFGDEELIRQQTELLGHLRQIAVGRSFRQKRKTLAKQISRIEKRLQDLSSNEGPSSTSDPSNQARCRSCNRYECDGKCWGFHGLARKRKLDEERSGSGCDPADTCPRITHRQELFPTKAKHSRPINDMYEFASRPPSMFRDEASGIRIPASTIRTLQCQTKAKWCGLTLVNVVQNQFTELRRPDMLRKTIEHGLLLLNGKEVTCLAEASEYKLRHSDCISRVVHWHEAPVKVPARISVQEVEIPSALLDGKSSNERFVVYVCNKPSTVPVHPAGPYFANSLSCMLEGQECLAPGSSKPIHRTDRATSGLTLFCTNAIVAKAFQRALAEGNAEKLYLARVGGKFPANHTEWAPRVGTIGTCEWRDEMVFVDAPVHTVDPAAGLRSICASGKSSTSVFRFVSYDPILDASVVACRPITGRNHQLRLHLSWMGYPIIGDTQYGGRSLSLEVNSSSSIVKQASNTIVELMLQRMSSERQGSICDDKTPSSDRRLTLEQRARRACSSCSRLSKEDIIDSFSPSQLLQDGHEIQLHALRYIVKFPSKTNAVKEVCFQVSWPSWTSSSGKEDLRLQWNEYEKVPVKP